MKRFFPIVSALAVMFAITSCGSAEKMAKQAENVIVKCNPAPLVIKGGKIEADLEVTYPKNYFNPNAVMDVTPVLVYANGEEMMKTLTYQGEKVKENNTVVPAAGGVVNCHVSFPYKAGMEKCSLELRSVCTTNGGKKWVALPVKKVAEGCIAAENLTCKKGAYSLKANGYQSVIALNHEGQVMFSINSSVVKSSEMKGESVSAFKEALKDAAANERMEIKGIEIVAYASPDGGEVLNDKLSDTRSKTARDAFGKAAKQDYMKGVSTGISSIGEDWDGFRELVKASNIEDKELILRVLEMYSDPNVREKEIKNMSSVFQELAKDVLPQLRRARFIASVEYTNYSDAELLALINENVADLDEPAMLKAAEICKDNATAKALYQRAVTNFNSEKAKFGLVVIALNENDLAEAEKAVAACDANDADVKNLKGVIALRKGDLAAAKASFEAAGTAEAQKNLGAVALLEGDYATAVKKCGNEGINASLARLLSGDNAGALQCLGDCQCPMSQYIRAIVYNRQGNVAKAKEALESACKDENLAARAKTDIEFSNL